MPRNCVFAYVCVCIHICRESENDHGLVMDLQAVHASYMRVRDSERVCACVCA